MKPSNAWDASRREVAKLAIGHLLSLWRTAVRAPCYALWTPTKTFVERERLNCKPIDSLFQLPRNSSLWEGLRSITKRTIG